MIIDVIDMNIGELKFKQQYDRIRKNRAELIYRYDEVTIAKVDKKANDIYNVEAIVNGNYDDYSVKLDIENHRVIKCSCECPDYDNGYICKHILATAMEVRNPKRASTPDGRKRLINKIRQQREKEQEEIRKIFEYRRKYSDALTTLQKFMPNDFEKFYQLEYDNYDLKDLYEESIEKLYDKSYYKNSDASNIKIEVQLDLRYPTNLLNISFKIGEKTKYVLKDLAEFYDAFKNNQKIYMGARLSFDAKRENFDTEELELLDFILKYGEILDYNKQIDYSSSRYSIYQNSYKSIVIKGKEIEHFFNMINKKTIQVTTYTEKDNYEFSNTPLKFDINLQKKGKDLLLKSNIGLFQYIEAENKFYVFKDRNIYELNKEGEIENALELFKENKEILIPEDKIEEFKQYVFPKISKLINESEESNTQIVNELSAKMFLDLDDRDNITMELKFCYGDIECNILNKDYERFMKMNNITRNTIKEREILEQIFMDRFELTNSKTHFVLKNEAAIYEFLSDRIEDYMNDFEIMITDKLRKKEIRKPKISGVSIKLNNGLLQMDISKIDFNLEEIKDVLKNYNIKKKYYKLKNGDFLSLEKSEDLELLNDISNSLDVDYSKVNKGIINLPVNRSIYLDQVLNKNKSITTSKNDDFNKLVNNVENKNFSENIVVEKKFEKILRDYQKVGYKWLKVLENYKLGGILADDMGLGKTLQIIALLESSLKERKTSIVVCPSSLVLNWKAEVEKWYPKMKVAIISGDAKTRKLLIEESDKSDLIVTSYDLLKRDIEEYENMMFKYIIADEAQYIKNYTTQNATSLKSLKGETKFALTGTPIENSVSELWSIFDFIMPGYLYTYNKFKKKFEEPIIKNQDKQALERLKKMINPFILRRTKEEVLTELPEKSITIMKNEMESEQKKIYLSYFAQTKKEVNQELSKNDFERSKLKILMLLTRLRQICCHPSLFIENYHKDSGKLNQCMDIIGDAIDSGHRILLFSSYTSMFDILEKKLQKKDIKYYKLVGGTPVNKRVEMVEQFNKDDNIKVFLISLKAGGTGLNLTGADVVIHFDPWWNVSAENQATDRAYRIGQKNNVQVYKLITTDSIEEKINKLQEKKAKIAKQLLSTEETFINKLTKEEIMDLFE